MSEDLNKNTIDNSNVNLVNNFIELLGEFLRSSKINHDSILEILKKEYKTSNMIAYLPKLFDVVLKYNDYIASKVQPIEKTLSMIQDSQPTKQEIAEIVNKAISSYNETNKKNIEELNKQSIEEFNKKIDEANKHSNRETEICQTQMIQMFKDLTNKVDRLESISQKKEVADVATQTFVNGLHSSNKKVYVENILNEDLECDKGDILINKHNTVGEEPIDNKKYKITPQCSQMDNTILEDITSEKNKQPTTKRQVVIDGSPIDKTRVVSEENKNIDKSKANESHEKLDLKAIMKISRETTIIKYKKKVGNDYTEEQFKNNKEIGIGCKHRAFLRFDGKMTSLSKDVFEKDTKLEKDTYYFEREGQKYLVFRNIDSANADVPNDSFTLMKLPEGCQKFDNNIVADVLNKARIDGIDGENSILIDSIEELQGLVVTDEKIKNKYFDEAKNRRVCSLLSSGDLMKTYTSEFEKDCKENEITDYKDYIPLNDEQLEFRSEKEIDNDIYIKPYVKTVENLLINSSKKNEKTSTAELKEECKMYSSLNRALLNRALIPETEIDL